MINTTLIERAACCGETCKRPPGDCVAATYGRSIVQRIKAAGYMVIPQPAVTPEGEAAQWLRCTSMPPP